MSNNSFLGTAPSGSTTVNSTPNNASYVNAGDAAALSGLQNGSISQVAGFTPAQIQAQQMASTQANQGSSAVTSANQYITNAGNGALLNNPNLSGAMGAANDAITRSYQTATDPQTQSQYAAAGRWGSGAQTNAESQNQQNLATQLGNTDASLANQSYQDGLSATNGALGQASSIAGAQYLPSQELSEVGQQQQTQNQNVDNNPYSQISRYGSLVNSGSLGSSTSTPYFTNTGASLLGGLSAANQSGLLGAAGNFLGSAAGSIGNGLSNLGSTIGNWFNA